MMKVPVETFAPLTELNLITHAFTLRATTADLPERLLQQSGLHQAATAEQTHGNEIAVVTVPGNSPQVDALATRQPGLPLIIRCADCAAVFIVDRKQYAIALVHSGKNGTRLNIAGQTLVTMREHFGTNPADCRVLISPCIGPCHYEVDIWAGIETQLRAAGVTDIHNPRICTACHLDRYFSYRAEKGKTGRMLALLALK